MRFAGQDFNCGQTQIVIDEARQTRLENSLDQKYFFLACQVVRKADEVFPDVPPRQWVISFPFPLRYLFAAHPQAMGKVLGIIYRTISTHLIHKAGFRLKDGATGAVSLRGPLDPALRLCS